MNVGIGYLHVGELYLNSAHYIAPDGEKSASRRPESNRISADWSLPIRYPAIRLGRGL